MSRIQLGHLPDQGMTGAGPATRFGGGGVREIGGMALGGTGGSGSSSSGFWEHQELNGDLCWR
jgi:hypothetical protein